MARIGSKNAVERVLGVVPLLAEGVGFRRLDRQGRQPIDLDEFGVQGVEQRGLEDGRVIGAERQSWYHVDGQRQDPERRPVAVPVVGQTRNHGKLCRGEVAREQDQETDAERLHPMKGLDEQTRDRCVVVHHHGPAVERMAASRAVVQRRTDEPAVAAGGVAADAMGRERIEPDRQVLAMPFVGAERQVDDGPCGHRGLCVPGQEPLDPDLARHAHAPL